MFGTVKQGVFIHLAVKYVPLCHALLCLSLYFIFSSPFSLLFSTMVLVSYGSSEHGKHMWSESGISICWRHLVTSSNPKFCSEKTCFTAYVRNMFRATILYAYHGSLLNPTGLTSFFVYVSCLSFSG